MCVYDTLPPSVMTALLKEFNINKEMPIFKIFQFAQQGWKDYGQVVMQNKVLDAAQKKQIQLRLC